MSENLVYAYGCGRPLAGWDHARAEHERCTTLWDQLVRLEQDRERDLLWRARCDEPRLTVIAHDIDALTQRLAEAPDDQAARTARRQLYAEQRDLLRTWRRAHKDAVRQFEVRRQAEVKRARQETDAWWPNYLRVLQSYETARAVNRQFGRRLRFHDVERDDGVLAVQIQRTPSGLGAAPEELRDGTVRALQISRDRIPGRRMRVLEMRVDAEGHTLRAPIMWHRELPEDARVKWAQFVWRRQGGRVLYRLCLTLAVPATPYRPAGFPVRPPAVVEFGWRPNGGLQVMSIGERHWSLPQRWVARMEFVDRMQQQLDDALAAGREQFALGEASYLKLFEELQVRWARLPGPLRDWYRDTRGLWKSLTGLRAHVLGERRDIYRRIAREIVQLYDMLQLPDLDLAAIATAERGEEANAWRHRAALHTLRAELLHQASKAGVPVLDASGRRLNDPADGRSSSWTRRKTAKAERSQLRAQAADV